MAFEMLVGLNVVDDASYITYRQKMTPILEEFGGGFRYDFKISEVLKSEADSPINRVFIIYFPNELAKNAFFSDAQYLKVRQNYFDKSVTSTIILASYDR